MCCLRVAAALRGSLWCGGHIAAVSGSIPRPDITCGKNDHLEVILAQLIFFLSKDPDPLCSRKFSLKITLVKFKGEFKES